MKTAKQPQSRSVKTPETFTVYKVVRNSRSKTIRIKTITCFYEGKDHFAEKMKHGTYDEHGRFEHCVSCHLKSATFRTKDEATEFMAKCTPDTYLPGW